MGIYYVGLVALIAALVARTPWFGFFAFSGVMVALQLFRGFWRYAGVFVPTVLIAIRQTGGFHPAERRPGRRGPRAGRVPVRAVRRFRPDRARRATSRTGSAS